MMKMLPDYPSWLDKHQHWDDNQVVDSPFFWNKSPLNHYLTEEKDNYKNCFGIIIVGLLFLSTLQNQKCFCFFTLWLIYKQMM